MAGRLMVHALKLAAGYDDISIVARGMEQMLNTPGELVLHRLIGSYCPPDRVISGTTATYDLCTDYLGRNEPAPVFGDYVATRPSKAHSEQYLLSSGASGVNCRWRLLGVTILASPLRARGLRYPT